MSSENTLKDKLLQLQEWFPSIIETVKKDLKNEHLKNDFGFVKRYLSGKNIHKVTSDEFVSGYQQALSQGENGNEVAEFIAHRWIFRNSEMYHFFEEQLKLINPEFTEIKELKDSEAKALIQSSIAEFGAIRSYIFSQINGVAFSSSQFKDLLELARKERESREEAAVIETKQRSFDEMKSSYETEIARMKDKYEKKLLGLQKKYDQDVSMLKKQIVTIQRKLAAV